MHSGMECRATRADGWMDGWTMGVLCTHTHTHIYITLIHHLFEYAAVAVAVAVGGATSHAKRLA